MTDAFVHHGVVMKPEEIKYHAPKADEAIEKLGLHDAPSAAEVKALLPEKYSESGVDHGVHMLMRSLHMSTCMQYKLMQQASILLFSLVRLAQI